MLDVSLEAVSFAYRRSSFAIRSVDLVCARSTHTALAGPPGAGATTLLKLIAGDLRPDSGEIRLGARRINELRRSRRPLLFVGAEPQLPGRWSVRHALVAAVRQRSLDRIDRKHEFELALSKWRLEQFAGRRLSQISTSERTLVQLAAIELMRPAVLVADRLFAGINPAIFSWAAGELYRAMRVIGATVITAPAFTAELGWADRVAILEGGTLLQAGRPAQVFAAPLGEGAAAATGDLNVIPVSIRGTTVESVVGTWELTPPPFQGPGIALARPDDFTLAERGGESDLIFSIEEAVFDEGRWSATGILSGGFLLRVTLPRAVAPEKGKLLPLRYDPSRFSLIQQEIELPRRSAPTDVVPPLRETR